MSDIPVHNWYRRRKKSQENKASRPPGSAVMLSEMEKDGSYHGVRTLLVSGIMLVCEESDMKNVQASGSAVMLSEMETEGSYHGCALIRICRNLVGLVHSGSCPLRWALLGTGMNQATPPIRCGRHSPATRATPCCCALASGGMICKTIQWEEPQQRESTQAVSLRVCCSTTTNTCDL